MQRAVPVDTPVGSLTGRSAIFLDEILFPAKDRNSLKLVGELNGRSCSRNPTGDNWWYSISFRSVQGVQIVELDFCDLADHVASFEEVVESDWLARMRVLDSAGKVDGDFTHYRFWTYDDVFEIVCARDFVLDLTVSDNVWEVRPRYPPPTNR